MGWEGGLALPDHNPCSQLPKSYKNEQDLSPDRRALLILHILFLETSICDLDFDMTRGGGIAL